MILHTLTQLSDRKCFTSHLLSVSYQGLFLPPETPCCTLSKVSRLSLVPHPSNLMSPPCTHRPNSSLQQLFLQVVWTTLRIGQCSAHSLTVISLSTKNLYTVLLTQYSQLFHLFCCSALCTALLFI